MSRSGYLNDGNTWGMIRWRGAVASAMRGMRGQAFLKELLNALDMLPDRKLIKNELEQDGAVCALGAVGRARGMDMSKLDPEDYLSVARRFGVAEALSREIVDVNDEACVYNETPECRFNRVRAWVEEHIVDVAPQSTAKHC